MTRKRFLGLVVTMFILSLTLVACGDPPVVPTYPGATSLNVPDSFNSFTKSSSVKNGTVTAYTTADSLDKVKSGLMDGFKKNSWDDKSSDKNVSDLNTQLTTAAAGSAVLGYQNSDTAAIVMMFPSALGSALGFNGAIDPGTIYVVLSGKSS